MARKAKGKRPVYFDDPQIDKLLGIVLALAGEVSVLREHNAALGLLCLWRAGTCNLNKGTGL